jgi:hypothetical protein
VTNDLASGPGSLRQALINANFTPGVDTITFDPAFFATPRVIPWTGGPIETLESLAIQGPAGRVTIDAGGSSRIFRLATSGSGAFNISNLIFANGRAVDAGGGAVVIGFDDQATFTNCSFTGNSAAGSGGAALHEGGPGGRLTFLQSTLTANTSASTGGAIMLEGGSTATASQLTVTDSTISGNRGTLGAGIYFRGFANVTITRSTLASNSASDIGGAVCTLGSASTAAAPSALTIVASAIVDNRATRGGGVMVQSRTVTTIESSTVSGNQTTEPANGRGGGIAVFGFATAGASFSMFNSTVTNNKSVGLTGGGIHLTRASSQPVVVQNSVISGNVQSDNTSPDFYGPATATGGHAFIGNIGTQPTTFSGSGNIIGTPASPVDALLAPIWTNGGPTLTHAPLPGSPLRDAGGSTAATTDQRGSPRTSGTAPDIGAVEIQQVAVTGVQINDGSAQRSRVSSLTVNFTGPVTVAAGAFQLVRQSDGAAVTMTATPSGNAVILSLTAGPVEFGSLADGRYTLTVTAAGVNQGGLPADFTLAGNPANGLFRLFGDSNGSGTVDANDFLAFRTAFLGTNPVFDFDGNGTVDAGDFLRFRVRFLQSV